MSTITERAKEQTFQDMDRMLHKLAHNSGIFDHEEAYQEAALGFAEAYHSYDPSRGSFSTWCYWRAKVNLLEKKRRESRYSQHVDSNSAVVEQTTALRTRSSDFRELLEDLGDDARSIVRLIMELPEDIGSVLLRKRSQRNLRKALHNYLVGLGWTAKQITESFSEIREALG